jgi:hypothetical protein
MTRDRNNGALQGPISRGRRARVSVGCADVVLAERVTVWRAATAPKLLHGPLRGRLGATSSDARVASAQDSAKTGELQSELGMERVRTTRPLSHRWLRQSRPKLASALQSAALGKSVVGTPLAHRGRHRNRPTSLGRTPPARRSDSGSTRLTRLARASVRALAQPISALASTGRNRLSQSSKPRGTTNRRGHSQRRTVSSAG